MELSTASIITFLVYLVVMLGIGLYAFSKTHQLHDYILGGRRIGPWTTALSAGASDMSGWLLLGLPGYAYTSGLVSVWLALGLLTGTYLNWHFISRPLRQMSIKLDNAVTLPVFFGNRFKQQGKALRIVSAIFILVFFVFYTSSGLAAGGKLFSSVFGLPYEWAVVAGTGAVVFYTFTGGFLAVAWTDLIQGLMMAVALIIAPLVAISSLDSGLFGHIEAKNPELLSLFSDNDGNAMGWIAIVSLLAWGLGYFGQPHILARFKAIRSADELTTAKTIAVSWTGLTLSGGILVGLVGISFFGEPLVDSEKVFIHLVNALFHPVVAGVLLAAILAAIMSTADSQLLVASSAFTEDLMSPILKGWSQKNMVWLGRITVVVIALIAMTIAFSPDSSILDMVSYA